MLTKLDTEQMPPKEKLTPILRGPVTPVVRRPSSARVAAAQRLLPPIGRNNPHAILRDIVNHSAVRGGMADTARTDSLGLVRRTLAGARQSAVDYFTMAKEDTVTFAAGLAVESTPFARTALSAVRLKDSANRLMISENAAARYSKNDPRNGLFQGIGRGLEPQFRDDGISYASNIAKDALVAGGVTGLISPIVGATAATLRGINGLADIINDDGVDKRNEFRKHPRGEGTLSQALKSSPVMANNAARAILYAKDNGFEPTKAEPFTDDRPETPLPIRAARILPYLKNGDLTSAIPASGTLRSRANFRHRPSAPLPRTLKKTSPNKTNRSLRAHRGAFPRALGR